jgi:dihydroflavonol-4-reductase
MRLVTGATGLVGSYVVCELLKQGFKVKALKRSQTSLQWFDGIAKANALTEEVLRQNLEWVEGTLEDIISLEDALEGVEKVYHCAAVVSFDKKDKDKLFETNVGGTANLVNACLYQKVKKLCYVSSIAALSRKKDGDEITENTEWEESGRNTNYAKSKFLGELEVWRGKEEGLEVVIVNPGFVLGFGNPMQSSASVFKKVVKGLKFYTEGINGFVDVVDVARASVLLNEGDYKSERFILVGMNLSYKDLFFKIASTFKVALPKYRISKTLAFWGIRVLRILSTFGMRLSFITPETLRTSVSTYYYSSEKLVKQTGFQFSDFNHTIERIEKEFRLYGGDSLK